LFNPNFSFVRFLFLLTLTGDGWLPLQETQNFFVDDPGKLYRKRRRATQAKGLETLDPKKEVVASVKTKGQSQPVKTKNTIKPKNKPVPNMVRKWVPKIATPAKSIDSE
jgi:hypothetical protein